jgi:hypothetical protein
MTRMIDQIRASKLPSNMMQFAARGALSVPPEESLEILVYLAKHNKVFGDLARITLAGWDEKTSLAAAGDPKTPREVLDYLVSPDNLRPKLLPALLENPAVAESELVKFARSASAVGIATLLTSARVRGAKNVLESLRANPYLKGEDSKTVSQLLGGSTTAVGSALPTNAALAAAVPVSALPAKAEAANPAIPAGSPVTASQSAAGPAVAATPLSEAAAEESNGDVPDEAVSAYLAEHAAEIVAEQDKPFQPVGGIMDLLGANYFPVSAVQNIVSTAEEPVVATPEPEDFPVPSTGAAAPVPVALRMNSMQKINSLDVKGRIQLALKGNKEERSILIRDGTKVVALAVLEAPKISDGEVEKFALQKNVLEAVLRQIPMKRRFMKNYIVVRNLCSNPRTPLDLGLGLMKHLQAKDLKNISGNKEVSETVRSLALKMYKAKMDAAAKK